MNNLNHYAYLDSVNQLSFALATYNVGIGHLIDDRAVPEQTDIPKLPMDLEQYLIKKMK